MINRVEIFETEEWKECFDPTAEGYLDLIELITDNERDTKKEKGFEIHHIIPRSYFQKKEKEIDNSEINLLKLLPNEHYMAHYYMSKCAKKIIKRSMVYALHLMTITATKRKCKFSAEQFSVMYAEVKAEFSKVQKIHCSFHDLTAEQRHYGFVKAMKNRSNNAEYRKYLSDRMKGNKCGEGHLKYSLEEINAITGMYNLGFTYEEINRYFKISHHTVKTQVERAIKKYGAENVIPINENNENTGKRATVYVYDKLLDNIIPKTEAEKREGVSDNTFLKRMQKEDYRYCITERVSIADIFDWLYPLFCEDPAIIDRIRVELEKMKEINIDKN
jgi:hypothetical protein